MANLIVFFCHEEPQEGPTSQDEGPRGQRERPFLPGERAEGDMKPDGQEDAAVQRLEDSGMHDMSCSEAQTLEEQSWTCVPQLFEDLKGSQRPLLMEICCTPESILTEVVQKGERHSGAAVRCSLFNGCDLSKGSGVRLVLERVKTERPRNVWISHPCDPYSPLQHLNERTETQRLELEEKRRHAQKVYIGASVIFRFCVEQGIHCTWEWAEKCEAWRLPVMQALRKRYQLHEAVTSGCRVNLRTKLDQKLMRKGWRIVTTQERLAQVLQLPC